MAKVINKTITTHLTNMKDGDVAEIVNWFCDEEMEPGTLGTVKVGVRIPQPRHLFPCSLVG